MLRSIQKRTQGPHGVAIGAVHVYAETLRGLHKGDVANAKNAAIASVTFFASVLHESADEIHELIHQLETLPFKLDVHTSAETIFKEIDALGKKHGLPPLFASSSTQSDVVNLSESKVI